MSKFDLPDAELDVLSALCRAKQATAAALRDTLEPIRPMAHGSVLTLLGRLESKKLVTRRKGDVGKAFVYRPTASGRAMFRPVVRNLLQHVFAGDSVQFVASLFESKPPDAEEIERLQAMLDDLREKRRQS